MKVVMYCFSFVLGLFLLFFLFSYFYEREGVLFFGDRIIFTSRQVKEGDVIDLSKKNHGWVAIDGEIMEKFKSDTLALKIIRDEGCLRVKIRYIDLFDNLNIENQNIPRTYVFWVKAEGSL